SGGGVADRHPGEAGEDPHQHPFEQHPGRGNEQAGAHRLRRRHAGLQPPGRRGKEREERAERRAGEAGDRRGHAAEVMQAHVDPRHPDAEEAQPEPEAVPGAALRRRVHPEMREDREAEERKRMQPEGREGEDRRCAGEQREKRAQNKFQDKTLFQVLGLSTRSVYTRRLSARSTWKRSPSSVTVSPRFGRRPRCLMKKPPMVSAASSANLEPKAALKSEICVSAFTRKRPPGSGRMLSEASSKSYSSSMSPTICSSTSSIVTRPATPPYSSITIAMWLRLARNSRSSTFRRLASGTNTAGRSISRTLNSSSPA